MKRLITTTCLCVLFVAGTALADWAPGDPHKMHFPQLPDPFGWDVQFSGDGDSGYLADDWQCSQTGLVTGVHIWISFPKDAIPDPLGNLGSFCVNIWGNDPGSATRPSMPDQERGFLYHADLGTASYTVRPYGTGEQGWFDPEGQVWNRIDHFQFFQVNFTLPDPMLQEKGEIYWLEIGGRGSGPVPFGWKTSLNHFMDDAVYGQWLGPWAELRDPITQQSLDLAFVITPEPATVALLGLGSLVLLRKQRA